MSSVSIGGFSAHGKIYDHMIRARIIYFSPLLKLRKFEIRNILIPSFVSVENPVYLNQINFEGGVRGLHQDFVFGYSAVVIRFESIFYTPLSFAGFKTAFSFFADSGWISPKDYLNGGTSFYGAYGIAIQIKNESLTIPTMSVQVAYYPQWNDQKDKFAVSVIFSDLRFFKDFLSLKPSTHYRF